MSGPEEPHRPSEPRRGPGGLRVPDPLAARRSMASAYQGAVEAVVAMVLCALAGYWLDSRLGSGPIGLFAGMVIGFAALVLRLLRIRTPSLGRATDDEPAARNASEAEAPPVAPSAGDPTDPDRDESWTQVLAPHRDLDEDDDPGGPRRS